MLSASLIQLEYASKQWKSTFSYYKWVCRTFLHRLAQDLKEELRDQIREGLIQTEQACLQWLQDEERPDAPNQKLEDLWSIPLPLERGELRVRE